MRAPLPPTGFRFLRLLVSLLGFFYIVPSYRIRSSLLSREGNETSSFVPSWTYYGEKLLEYFFNHTVLLVSWRPVAPGWRPDTATEKLSGEGG